MNAPNHERMMELLAESTLFVELEDQDQRELDALVADSSEIDHTELELAAAALELSSLPSEMESLPASLAKNIEAVAHRDFSHTHGEQDTEQPPRQPTHIQRDDSPAIRQIVQWTGWVVAAGLLIALMQMGRPSGSSSVRPTLAQLRSNLIETGGELIQRNWQTTKHKSATGATGDVVWHNEKQEGYMRIGGLVANDPTVEQYQLWIFDETQKHPVDGGVFNMPADGGEAIIPITAKIGVKKPTLFAITIEKPGGVVVSDQNESL